MSISCHRPGLAIPSHHHHYLAGTLTNTHESCLCSGFADDWNLAEPIQNSSTLAGIDEPDYARFVRAESRYIQLSSVTDSDRRKIGFRCSFVLKSHVTIAGRKGSNATFNAASHTAPHARPCFENAALHSRRRWSQSTTRTIPTVHSWTHYMLWMKTS